MATYSASNSRAASPSQSSGSESPSRGSGSREVSASASAGGTTSKGIFYRADTTFNPAPYHPPQRTLPLYRPSALHPVGSTVFESPQATAPPFDGMFIHPPFTNLPESVVLTDGMTYSIMHQHPGWFLDIKDYITLDANLEGAIRYPRELEPPRPRRQKDLLLRCTFCPRTYAGVNAKSMWTRHVREKHRVVLSKAWSDTATSSRRQSTGKSSTGGVPPLSPTDTATSSSRRTSAPLTTVPLSKAVVPPVPPKTKAAPAPKPPKQAKTTSPAKAAAAKRAAAATLRKIVIPAMKPAPAPPPPVRAPSPSPPPPEGILPPRMRPFLRKSFRPSQGPFELKVMTAEGSKSGQPSVESEPASSAPALDPTVTSAVVAMDSDSIASTPTDVIPSSDVPNPATAVSTDGSISNDQTTLLVSGTSADRNQTVDTPPNHLRAGSDDGDSIATDKEVADLLLSGMDMSIDESDEDVDMELEDEEDGLHPPISLGGLAEPMFGVEDSNPDAFSLRSRPAISPMFSPALSPELSITASREQSVEPHRIESSPDVELPDEQEPPPLGRSFKVSSLAYLMDKTLSVSPPSSPPPPPPRSLTPVASTSTDMDDASPTATMFAAMQDVFVIQMQKMTPKLREKFLGHLEEQFGIHVKREAQGQITGGDDGEWANLTDSALQHIVSMGSSEKSLIPMDTLGGEFDQLTDEFKQGSAGQLKDDLEEQLKELVSQFTDELIVPLREALTMQLKDEIIVQVADQMMDALVVQGEEAQIEFEWRRQFLERQLWAEDNSDDVTEELIQHPLHHLFLGKAGSSDMDVRMLAT